MKVTTEGLRIEGAKLEGENPLPMFRNSQRHREVTDNGSLTPEHKLHMGENTGERYLPYRIQDRYSRKRETIELKTIVLENDKLRAVFLPEYGGRLYSLQEKSSGRELLYRNPVFQPANLAILNAWFSGGIEWNIGHLGHTFTTCSPVHAAKLGDDEGNEFLRIYEYERCKNLFWHIDFHLPPGAEQLGVYVRIVNDQDAAVPMYWWTNTAVPETERARVFSGTGEVIYIDPTQKGYGADRLPYLPAVPEADVSYPMAFPYASEYFFQTPVSERSPWEAVAYKDGHLFYERSTSMLRYRKMFCWGAHVGGRRWCDFLAKPGEGYYIEVQAGLAPTQLHGIEMPADSEWEFTQLIGGLDGADLQQVYQESWEEARSYVEGRIADALSEEDVYAAHEKYRALAGKVPEEMLHAGSGWGALERVRRAHEGGRGDGRVREIPRGFIFADATLGVQQQPWLALLREGELLAHHVDEVPASWMIQDEWMDMLSASVRRSSLGGGAGESSPTWNAYLHYGVMLYEQRRESEAIEAWEASVSLAPSAWAYRNLAVAMRQQGNFERALSYYEQAYAVADAFPDRAFVEEYLGLLIQHKEFERAWGIYESLPPAFYASDRIQIIVGAAALELGHDAFMEKLFATEFAVIREGETLIIELWYAYNAKKLAVQQGVELTKERIEEAKVLFPPPSPIDFRTIG
ncbi:uncharacterized protein DUF5107 [Paenibacillus taihuensis]|uniref:Uncharacterized protein DUF5107 n=1 Tax=Paenibacillus taihuensis TaxID=1156355 RepID=A0A3D9RTX3_9BACL|nr:DUF5107 domain-containing protein [Paenibacillus taihuensis]REE80145.1 uncharacterized protein DUF5107 [Paenibacillus taihuensis]